MGNDETPEEMDARLRAEAQREADELAERERAAKREQNQRGEG